MENSSNTSKTGVFQFQTDKGCYLYSSFERALYRLTRDKDPLKFIPLAVDARPFDIPSIKSLEDILNSQLSQLVLNFTEQCNLRCKYCIYGDSYRFVRGYSDRFMEMEVAFKAVDYFLQRAKIGSFITFYGGEPLLRFKELVFLVDYVRHRYPEKEVKISIATNATLLDEARVDELVRREVFLQISLDGPSVIHDFNRVYPRGQGTFEKIYRVIQYIYDKYPDFYPTHILFEVTLTPATDLYTTWEFFKGPLFEDNLLKVGFLDPEENYYVEKFCSSEQILNFKTSVGDLLMRFVRDLEQQGKSDKFLWELFGKRLMDIHMLLGSEPGDAIPLNGTCIPGIKKLYVDVQGRFYPCEKVHERLAIGSVEKGIEIAKVAGLLKKYESISTNCRSCFAKDLCKICFAGIASTEGDLSIEKKLALCQKEKKEIEDAFVLYARLMESNPHALDFLEAYVFE